MPLCLNTIEIIRSRDGPRPTIDRAVSLGGEGIFDVSERRERRTFRAIAAHTFASPITGHCYRFSIPAISSILFQFFTQILYVRVGRLD